MKRAAYNKKFKMRAVKLAQGSDQSVNEAAWELSISGTTLRSWINKYDE